MYNSVIWAEVPQKQIKELFPLCQQINLLHLANLMDNLVWYMLYWSQSEWFDERMLNHDLCRQVDIYYVESEEFETEKW